MKLVPIILATLFTAAAAFAADKPQPSPKNGDVRLEGSNVEVLVAGKWIPADRLAHGDFNGDGRTDQLDYAIWSTMVNQPAPSPTPSPTPTPTTTSAPAAADGIPPVVTWNAVPGAFVKEGDAVELRAYSLQTVHHVTFSLRDAKGAELASQELPTADDARYAFRVPKIADQPVELRATIDDGDEAKTTLPLVYRGAAPSPNTLETDWFEAVETAGDGGIVELPAGKHRISASNLRDLGYCNWVTIRPAAGAEVTIAGGDTSLPGCDLHLVGLTIEQDDGKQTIRMSGDQHRLWLDGCTLVGRDRHVELAHPVRFQCFRRGIWYTHTKVSNVRRAFPGAVLISACEARGLGEDAAQNVPTVLDMTVNDIHPIDPSVHADVWQVWGAEGSGYVIDGVTATDLHGAGLFIGKDSAKIVGMVIRNVDLSWSPPIVGPTGCRGQGGRSSIDSGRQIDGLLFENNKFRNGRFSNNGRVTHYRIENNEYCELIGSGSPPPYRWGKP